MRFYLCVRFTLSISTRAYSIPGSAGDVTVLASYGDKGVQGAQAPYMEFLSKTYIENSKKNIKIVAIRSYILNV